MYAIITWLLAQLANFRRSDLWANIRALKPRTGVITEYCGPGRVRFFSFFRGAGYVIRWRRGRGWDGKPLDAPGWRPNIELRGFTIYFRTHKSLGLASWGRPVRAFRITRNPNQSIV